MCRLNFVDLDDLGLFKKIFFFRLIQRDGNGILAPYDLEIYAYLFVFIVWLFY